MRARWVCNNPSPKLPLIGRTVVASFWPGRYYLVSTYHTQQDSSNPLYKLEIGLEKIFNKKDLPSIRDIFFTTVCRCDKDGLPPLESIENPLFEQEYSDLSHACDGHNGVVDLLSKGQLKFVKSK